MIIPRESSNVISKNMDDSVKLSVRQEDIQHIIHLLSTNLYSQPIESLVRELVSNAIDATVEAGNNNPVLIKISEKGEFSVTDFGTGISPQRFEELYTNFGASSKRDSNDYIGSFGIGRLSPLSYTDLVTITTVYEGIKYEYALLKDGLQVSFNTISEEPTEELDGTCVKLQIKKNDFASRKFQDAIIAQLFFFEDIVVIDESRQGFNESQISSLFKERIIKDFTHFKLGTSSIYNSNVRGIKILLGNVLYPLKDIYVDQLIDQVGKSRYSDYFFTLKFSIGELNVTPNREEIIYSASTIKKIEEKIKAAVKEFKEIKDQHNTAPIELEKAFGFFTQTNLKIHLHEDNLNLHFPFYLQKEDFFTVKMKDKTYQLTYEACREVFETCRYNFNYKTPMGGIKLDYSSIGESLRSSVPFKDTTEIFEKICKKKFYVENIKTLKPITKEYLRERLSYPVVFSANTLRAFRGFSKNVFKEIIRKRKPCYQYSQKQEIKKVLRFLNDLVFDKEFYTIIDDNIVPSTYSRPKRVVHRSPKKEKVTSDQIVSIPARVYTYDDYGRLTRTREEIFLNGLSDKIFIYLDSEMDADDPVIRSLINLVKQINSYLSKNIVFGIISQVSEKILKDLNSPNVHSFNEFFKQNENVKTWIKDLHYVLAKGTFEQFPSSDYGHAQMVTGSMIREIYWQYFDNIRDFLKLSSQPYIPYFTRFVKDYKQFSCPEEVWDEPSEGLKAVIETPERDLIQQYFEVYNNSNPMSYEDCILLEKCLNLDLEQLIEMVTNYKKQKQKQNETN